MSKALLLVNECLLAGAILFMALGFTRAEAQDPSLEYQVQQLSGEVIRNDEQIKAIVARMLVTEESYLRLSSKLDYALFGITMSLLGHMLNGAVTWKRRSN